MESYKNITIFENQKRIKELVEFRELIVNYFNEEDDFEKQRLRSKINIKLQKIHSLIEESGVLTLAFYTSPPILGGKKETIELLQVIFNLNSYNGIQPNDITDPIERSIGVYEDDKINSILRTINPFFWINKIIKIIVKIPFDILGVAGFPQVKIEESFFGKIIKFILYLITAIIIPTLPILYSLGYLDKFKNNI